MSKDFEDEEDFEELYGPWEPSLYNAVMANERHFAMLVGGPRWDDPYTIILKRDTVDRTFSRSDVRRELTGIEVMPDANRSPDDEPSYVALSISGDIYIFHPEITEHFIIPGTKAESEDNPDILFFTITPMGDQFLVAGTQGWLKLGHDKTWQDVAPKIDVPDPYSPPEYRIIGVDQEDNLFLEVKVTPSMASFNLYPGHPLYRDDMSDDEKESLQKKLDEEYETYPVLTKLYTGKPGNWKKHDLPDRIAEVKQDSASLSNVCRDKQGFYYVLGDKGLIMKGSAATGFSDISFAGDRNTRISFGEFLGDRMIVTTHDGVSQFDGHMLSPFVPKIKVNSPPYLVQTSNLQIEGGKAYLFDYQLRYFWTDGATWGQYDIPKELSERPFKGNPPRK
ncbi:hypothetical protein [Oryzifoliimicrobium ureilyticus]|uniref:hypothetical protein n=1 Tax=Oryzifoliimicrobium ureilyticus TaxID=3113724 RepID=UPI0030761391